MAVDCDTIGIEASISLIEGIDTPVAPVAVGGISDIADAWKLREVTQPNCCSESKYLP